MGSCGEHSSVRFKQRAVIEFLTAEGVAPVEIHRRVQVVYGDDFVGVSTVRRWANRYKGGETGISGFCDKEFDDL
jgi:transposase